MDKGNYPSLYQSGWMQRLVWNPALLPMLKRGIKLLLNCNVRKTRIYMESRKTSLKSLKPQVVFGLIKAFLSIWMMTP